MSIPSGLAEKAHLTEVGFPHLDSLITSCFNNAHDIAQSFRRNAGIGIAKVDLASGCHPNLCRVLRGWPSETWTWMALNGSPSFFQK